MSESTPHDTDQDPAPLEHADAERVGADDADPQTERQAEDIEDDPASNPQEPALRDVKGG